VRDARSVIRNHLLPPFGDRRLEDITEQEIDRWARRLGADRPLSNATKRKVIVIFNGVMARACRVYRLPLNQSPASRSRGSRRRAVSRSLVRRRSTRSSARPRRPAESGARSAGKGDDDVG
jgi:hypothetical protein